MLKTLNTLLAAACLLVASAGATGVRVNHLEPADLTTSRAKDGRTRLQIALAGQMLQASLSPNEALLANMPRELGRRLAAQGVVLFSGKLDGVEGSWIRLSQRGQRWQGAWFDGVTLFLLDPAPVAKQFGRLPSGVAHAAFRLEDVVIEGLDHDIAGRPGGYVDWIGELASDLSTAKAGLKELELTVVTDTEFSAHHDSNRDAAVADRLNVVDGIYQDQLSVQITLTHLRHLSDNGPLTMTLASGGSNASPDLLTTFRSYMFEGIGSSIPKADLNHLFSGKDFDGSTAGVAYVNVLCNSQYGYAINQVRSSSITTALIIAHEMGHNVGASHDGQSGSSCAAQIGGWIMSPSISSANRLFSPCSQAVMSSRIASASCLGSVVLTPPGFYADGFEQAP